jgi:hypothetical protein
MSTNNNKTWRERLYSSGKLENYVKKAPKSLQKTLGMQMAVNKNLKFKKLLQTNEEMVAEVAKLREANGALKERVGRHYNEQVDGLDEVAKLRQDLKETKEALKEAQERIEEFSQLNQCQADSIGTEVIEQILKMDQKHLNEKKEMLKRIKEYQTKTEYNSIHSEANSSLKSDEISNLSNRNTSRDDSEAGPASSDGFELEEESEEEFDGNFHLRKSLAANRVSMAANSKPEVTQRRKTKRMTKVGQKRKSSMQAAENPEQTADIGQRRKSSRKTVNFNFSLDESQMDQTLSETTVANVTTRRRSKRPSQATLAGDDTSLQATVCQELNYSLEETVREDPSESKSLNETENKENDPEPLSSPPRDENAVEAPVLGQRSSRRNRKQGKPWFD